MELIHGLTLPDGRRLGAVLPLDPWIERHVLGPILARRKDGLPSHPMAWIELARGHAKTSTAGAVALVEALSEAGTHVFVVAADAEQARLLIEYLSGQCFRNPRLSDAFRQTRDEFTVKANGSKIKVMSSDVPSFYGVGVDARRLRIIADELCQWRSRDMYDAAMTTVPKVPDNQLIVITNAGVIGSWQEEARREFKGSGGYLYAPEGVIASWIRPEDLERVRRNVPPAVYALWEGKTNPYLKTRIVDWQPTLA